MSGVGLVWQIPVSFLTVFGQYTGAASRTQDQHAPNYCRFAVSVLSFGDLVFQSKLGIS